MFASQAFVLVLGASTAAAFLAVGVRAITGLLGARIPPRWLHLLWVLAVARLALPLAIPTPLSPLTVLPRVFPGRPFSSELFTGAGSRTTPAALYGSTPFVSPPDASDAAARPRTADRDAQAPATLQRFLPLVPWIWLAGMTLVAAAGFLLHARFRVRLEAEPATMPGRALLSALDECRRAMGVRRPVRLALTSQVATPSLYGVLRPRILLPATLAGRLSRSQLRALFLHELAHLSRHDNVVNLLASALRILHWFNPLAWYAAHRMRADAELACDVMALGRVGAAGRRVYGLLLLQLAGAAGPVPLIRVGASMSARGRQMRKRISMIAAAGGRHRRSVTAVAVVMAIGLAVVSLTAAEITKDQAIAAVQLQRDQAQFSNGALDELASIAEGARHNYDVIEHAAFLIAHVGDGTGNLLSIALIAAGADREIPAFSDILDLSVRGARGQQDEEIARAALRGDVSDAELESRVADAMKNTLYPSVDAAVAATNRFITMAGPIEQGLRDVPEARTELLALRSLAAEARYNAPTIARAAEIITRFSYNRGAVLSIARFAAWSHREIPGLLDVVDLAVLKTSETGRVVQLAGDACLGKIDDAMLAAQIEALRLTADYGSLEQAAPAAASRDEALTRDIPKGPDGKPDLETMAKNSPHNKAAILRAGYVISHVGWHTGAVLEIARLAAAAPREIPRLEEVVDLAVMKLSETARVVELAADACAGRISDAALASRIDEIRARADYKTLDDAAAKSAELSGR